MFDNFTYNNGALGYTGGNTALNLLFGGGEQPPILSGPTQNPHGPVYSPPTQNPHSPAPALYTGAVPLPRPARPQPPALATPNPHPPVVQQPAPAAVPPTVNPHPPVVPTGPTARPNVPRIEILSGKSKSGGASTDQQRKMTPFSLTPPEPVDRRVGMNEMLMRVGGAMMGGAQQGGLNAMDKGLAAYGDIQDYNRQAGVNQYEAELDTYNKGMAALIKAQGKNKNKGGDPAALMGSIVVNDALSRALPLIGPWTTGYGSYLAALPQTDARDLRGLIDTMKSNAGFDKLNAMRQASPTGGALGQVSERELAFLQNVFGNLEQDQSASQLKYNMELFRYVYNTMIHGFDGHPYQAPAGAEAMITELRATMGGSGSDYDYSAADAIVGN